MRLYCLYTALKSVTLTYVTFIPTWVSCAAHMCPFRTLSYEGAFDIGKLGTFVISGGTANSYRSRTVYKWGGGPTLPFQAALLETKSSSASPCSAQLYGTLFTAVCVVSFTSECQSHGNCGDLPRFCIVNTRGVPKLRRSATITVSNRQL